MTVGRKHRGIIWPAGVIIDIQDCHLMLASEVYILRDHKQGTVCMGKEEGLEFG